MIEQVKREVKIIRPTIGVVPEKKIRVAAYCRVSTDSEDQSNSFITQVKYYNDFIRLSDNMVLVDIYADEGITGTSINKRDDFNRMIKDSKAGKIDRVYVKSVTRFARNSLECIENIRLLKSYGTSVLFENDAIDTETMNSEMILYIKSAFAQSEALSGSKRVSTAFRMKMETGTFCSYHAPFGYTVKDNHLVPIPEEAEIVKKIFDYYLRGLGASKIVIRLNEEETIGKPWGVERVKYILSNEKYIGDSLWQKTFTPAILPFRSRRNNGEMEKFYVENTHEAIIDKAVFEKVQMLKKAQRRNNTSYTSNKQYKFSGMIFCGDCGWSYKRRPQKHMVSWVCSKDGTAGHSCFSHAVPEECIEKTFVNMYNKLRQHEAEIISGTLNELLEVKKKLSSENAIINDIDVEIAELCEQNNMFVKMRSRNIIDEVSYMEQTGELHKRISELRSRRKKILKEDDEEQCIEELRELKTTLGQLPKVLLWFDEKVFLKTINKILVMENSLVFELKSGLHLKEKIIWK